MGRSSVDWKSSTFLTTSELLVLSNLIKESSAVPDKGLVTYLLERLQKNCQSDALTQLVTHLPVILLNKGCDIFLINLHQLGLNSKELDRIFEMFEDEDEIPRAEEPKSKRVSQGGGRKSILHHFPNIHEVATEFLKSQGFQAQEKRRETTITLCGVSVSDVRMHLLDTTPGLKDFGLSESTVKSLFKPVRRVPLLLQVTSQLLM